MLSYPTPAFAGPVYCTCGPYMVCGAVIGLGCRACTAAVAAGRSCGTSCSATRTRLRVHPCWLCGVTINGSLHPSGYCGSCASFVAACQSR